MQPSRAVATVAGRCNRRGPLQPPRAVATSRAVATPRAVATAAGRCNRRGPLQPPRAVATVAGPVRRKAGRFPPAGDSAGAPSTPSTPSAAEVVALCATIAAAFVRSDRSAPPNERTLCAQQSEAKQTGPQICAVEVPAQMWPTDQLERACVALGGAWRWAVRGAGPTVALPCTTADGRCSHWYSQVLSGTTQDSAPPESRDVRRVKPFGASPSATGEHAMTDSNVPAWLSMHALHRLAQWQVRS